MSTAAWPDPPVTLDALSASWRLALGAAHEALAAAAPSLPAAELSARGVRLNREREQVDGLLRVDALAQHVRLVRHLSLPTVGRAQLGLPSTVDACIFELDGVLAPSADVHFAAWSEVLDRFVVRRTDHVGHYAMLSRREYAENIHGLPRLDGVRSFLASRGLTLPTGAATDPPSAETVHGLARAKNDAVRSLLAHGGIGAFAGATRYLEAVASAGLGSIVVSASANTTSFLTLAELTGLVDVVVDGDTMRTDSLQPKPAPDVLLAACARIGIAPGRAAAFETTSAGVRAARAAHVAFVVGVTRSESDERLDADRVVGDLGDLL